MQTNVYDTASKVIVIVASFGFTDSYEAWHQPHSGEL